MARKRKYDARNILKDSKEVRRKLCISRRLGENSNVQKILYVSSETDPFQWTVVLHPTLIYYNLYHIKIYDSIKSLEDAEHCISISMDAPVYIETKDYSKSSWVLSDEEKIFLCKIIDIINWENIVKTYSNLIKRYNPNSYIHDSNILIRPDYMKLPTEIILNISRQMGELDDNETVYWFGLSRELTEFSEIQGIISKPITDENKKWIFAVYPPIERDDIVYFIIYNYDNEYIDPFRIEMCNAKKMTRISMKSAEYIHCIDSSKDEWILSNEEKQYLCKLLHAENGWMWDSIKYIYSDELNFYDGRELDLSNLQMPDYMQLPEE